MRIFGGEKMMGLMERLGMKEGEVIEHPWVNRAIENAQRKVEGHNFDIRKHLLEYDDVMNMQRKVIYKQRRDVLSRDDVNEVILDMIHDLVEDVSLNSCQEKLASEDWDWQHISEQVVATFGLPLDWDDNDKTDLTPDAFEDQLLAMVKDAYAAKEADLGEEHMRYLERIILLQMVDNHWKDHLLGMDHLRQGIGLRGYGQKNPLDEYKREGFDMFTSMIETVKIQTVSTLLRIQLASESDMEEMEARQRAKQEEQLAQSHVGGPDDKQQPTQRQGEKVGRNAACPCGSGKKYKRCCGKKQ